MPTWRQVSFGWPLVRVKPDGENWDRIRKGGANGFVMLIIATSWWLKKASTASARAEVASVVEDLAFVLDQLTVSPDAGGGHGKGEMDLWRASDIVLL